MDTDRLARDMRALLVSLTLLLPALAGCLAAQTDGALTGASALDLATRLEVPDGAELVQTETAAILRFVDVELPFRHAFALPEGATVVRAVGTVADGVAVSAYLYNEETGRRRCNPDSLDAWNVRVTGVAQCSGITALDPPGSMWVATVNAPALAPDTLLGAATPRLGTVDLVFETAPLDGLAAQLDLTQLSMPTHDLLPTEYLEVPSFDGTPLWVEVTLPEGEGPWPTVIAASPYNGQAGRGETPAMWEYWTQDWAKRGYAAVNVDVRGFGMSGGCVEVWSENEQKDQAFIVDWVAEQAWSDGNVGFYGQSYVGTTPVAAAVQAPEALKAIIAVAPVINTYYDWHFGGVPNGENSGSPVAYQVLTDSPLTQDVDPMDPLSLVEYNAKGLCDPTLVVRANDPRAVYDAFYEERNFTLRAGDVTAAVLYTQGFEDSNVKSAMIPWWFNEIQAPKLGLFGHWVHQHPTRTDQEILFLGWMDQYVKGKALGFEKLAPAQVVVDDTTSRGGQTWPPVEAVDVALATDFAGGKLGPDASGDGQLLLAPAGAPGAPEPLRTRHVLEMPIDAPLALAGIPRVAVEGMLMNGGNAYFYAELWDVGGEKDALVTYGMFNLAHRNGHDQFAPAAPAETVTFELPFLPTEWVFREGHTLRLVLTGTADRGDTPGQPGSFMLHGGEKTQLLLPTLDMGLYEATAATALR